MRPSGTLAGLVLAVVSAGLPAVASAQSPYAISGLHSELSFTEAVAQAEKLGGNCRANALRPGETGKSVQCDYSRGAGDIAEAGLAFASQAIVSIALDAPAVSARVTRIVLVYSGDTDALAAGLVEEFGPTESNGAPTGETSWSHARRWSWRAGPYRMGLLDSPPLIILATDQAQASPAVEGPVSAAP